MIHVFGIPICFNLASAQASKLIITLTREARAQAVASIGRYFLEDMEDKISKIAAGGLRGFFLEELGPPVYNQAVAEVQERLQQRVSEIDIEVHEDEFSYWRKFDKLKKSK